VPSIIARDFEIQIAILEHEKSVLCDFINRELKMTGNDPRIAELEKRLAAMPNDRSQDARPSASKLYEF
jgi:hypothetical protein